MKYQAIFSILAASSVAILTVLYLNAPVSTKPEQSSLNLLVAGYGGQLETYSNYQFQEFQGQALKDVSWIQSYNNGYMLSGEFGNQLTYFSPSTNEKNTLYLKQLKAPVATTSDKMGRIVAACYGSNNEGTAGIALINNNQLIETAIPKSYKPSQASPVPNRQAQSHVHFVKSYGDVVLATDLGYDHLYAVDVNGNIEIKHTFPRGTGPRHIDFDSEGSIYIISEMVPALTKLDKNFNQVGYMKLSEDPNLTGAEIHIAKSGIIFISLRDESGKDGKIQKLNFENGQFKVIQEGIVGNLPRQFSLSQDESKVFAGNQNGKNVDILDAKSLKKIQRIETPSLNPCFVTDKFV